MNEIKPWFFKNTILVNERNEKRNNLLGFFGLSAFRRIELNGRFLHQFLIHTGKTSETKLCRKNETSSFGGNEFIHRDKSEIKARMRVFEVI